MAKVLAPSPRAAARSWLFLSFVLVACTDAGNGIGAPGGEGHGKAPDEIGVCTTCQQRAGGETADFGAAPGSGSSCYSVEAPLTDAVEQSFDLAQVRATLAGTRRVIAEPRDVLPGQPALSGPVEIELQFELGEFTYRTGERCDSVSAPLKLTAQVGDGLLAFEARGGVFKEAGKLHAILYAKADLAQATGSYRPVIDTNRPHAGQIEVSIYVFPDLLRGTVIPELLYFASEELAQGYLNGETTALPKLEALAHLDFPHEDDGCEDHELPLTRDVALEMLGGKSPEQLQREVMERLQTPTSIAAVWRDDHETSVQVEFAASLLGTVCADSTSPHPAGPFRGSEIVVTLPVTGALRTSDGKIDAQLDRLSIIIGMEGGELRTALFRSPSTPERSEWIDARVTYTFEGDTPKVEGIARVAKQASPGAGTYTDCVAFPPGGKSDTDDCRYRR